MSSIQHYDLSVAAVRAFAWISLFNATGQRQPLGVPQFVAVHMEDDGFPVARDPSQNSRLLRTNELIAYVTRPAVTRRFADADRVASQQATLRESLTDQLANLSLIHTGSS